MKLIFFMIPSALSFSIRMSLNNIKYTPNIKKPSDDLKLIDSRQASLTSRKWMQNIVEEYLNYKHLDFEEAIKNKSDPLIGDFHILDSINSLEDIISENNKDDIFLAWIPKPTLSYEEILFIIVATCCDDTMDIKMIVQSPKWDPIQIPTLYLKSSLEDLSVNFGFNKINFDYLYKHDLRSKLAWSTWNLKN